MPAHPNLVGEGGRKGASYPIPSHPVSSRLIPSRLVPSHPTQTVQATRRPGVSSLLYPLEPEAPRRLCAHRPRRAQDTHTRRPPPPVAAFHRDAHAAPLPPLALRNSHPVPARRPPSRSRDPPQRLTGSIHCRHPLGATSGTRTDPRCELDLPRSIARISPPDPSHPYPESCLSILGPAFHPESRPSISQAPPTHIPGPARSRPSLLSSHCSHLLTAGQLL